MRIYQNLSEAVRETERDLWEMGIDTRPSSMQDKVVQGDDDYATRELRAYGFQIRMGDIRQEELESALNHVHPNEADKVKRYIFQELVDRTGGIALNPGNSFNERKSLWSEYLHDGKFHYTYSERMAPQVEEVIRRLRENRDSRQCIIQFFTALQRPNDHVDGDVPAIYELGIDHRNAGGIGRIPCSMYYQLMAREGSVDLVYTMRSCDFLNHFLVDIVLAMMFRQVVIERLGLSKFGTFTYFTGSLHAYRKDMRARGVF